MPRFRRSTTPSSAGKPTISVQKRCDSSMSRTFNTRWLMPRGVTGLSIAQSSKYWTMIALFRRIRQVLKFLEMPQCPFVVAGPHDPAVENWPAAAGTLHPQPAGLELGGEQVKRHHEEDPALQDGQQAANHCHDQAGHDRQRHQGLAH